MIDFFRDSKNINITRRSITRERPAFKLPWKVCLGRKLFIILYMLAVKVVANIKRDGTKVMRP